MEENFFKYKKKQYLSNSHLCRNNHSHLLRAAYSGSPLCSVKFLQKSQRKRIIMKEKKKILY